MEKKRNETNKENISLLLNNACVCLHTTKKLQAKTKCRRISGHDEKQLCNERMQCPAHQNAISCEVSWLCHVNILSNTIRADMVWYDGPYL